MAKQYSHRLGRDKAEQEQSHEHWGIPRRDIGIAAGFHMRSTRVEGGARYQLMKPNPNPSEREIIKKRKGRKQLCTG